MVLSVFVQCESLLCCKDGVKYNVHDMVLKHDKNSHVIAMLPEYWKHEKYIYLSFGTAFLMYIYVTWHLLPICNMVCALYNFLANQLSITDANMQTNKFIIPINTSTVGILLCNLRYNLATKIRWNLPLFYMQRKDKEEYWKSAFNGAKRIDTLI